MARRRSAAERFRDAAHARRVRHQDETRGYEDGERIDCLSPGGADRLLIALRRRHAAPPADVRPSPFDGVRFDWRSLVAGPDSLGASPAFACTEA